MNATEIHYNLKPPETLQNHNESQNQNVWKGPMRITEVQLLVLCRTAQELHHLPESIDQTLPELCQAWSCDHSLGEPVPVPNHPLFFYLVIGHKTEEISACLSTSPHETTMRSSPSSLPS